MEDEIKEKTNFDLDSQWSYVSAVRETFGIASKGTRHLTYNQSVAAGMILSPVVLNEESELITSSLSKTALEFKQRSEAKSLIVKNEVSPIELINSEISELAPLANTGGERNQILRRISDLYNAREELSLTPYTENQIIFQDYNSERNLPVSGSGKNYKQFKVSNQRVLRIRVLHPDKAEFNTGTDVIYENYWVEKQLVRIAAIQYKVWEDKTFYSEPRLEKQLAKMQSCFCDNNLCNEDTSKHKYRLPYCSAFLRPTDKLQLPNSKRISSGYHVPLCVVNKSWSLTNRGGKKFSSYDIRDECVTQKNFEELFNSNMLGSKWIKIQELEGFYKEKNVLETSDKIIIHAQEF